ncbi:hypothetical protein N7462_007270 [Penicillium macrosclerotiorum]|uniref:uncharacterized protein n=1 Tax=Penicillium macrosclerotiorum TaxID=303699 RepID=UPI0025474E36|nr:uncharacterized protein N7462_007270 [Penicillium macrosclerotiorum]KAJ5679026.1 hypothetical protein N7462_007270 [Penicillium macrosclerotiorum]
MDEDLDIVLLPEGEEGAEFRTKSAADKARIVALQAHHGDALLLRANVVSITHGTLTPEGDEATLIVFEFRFISMQKSRRFTQCLINIAFEDAAGDWDDGPEVHRIAPDGVSMLNQTTTLKDVRSGAGLMVQAGSSPLSTTAGLVWEIREQRKQQFQTTLTGSKKLLHSRTADDAVVWSMQENRQKKDGIPTFLRAAVLLRRPTEGAFSFLIQVRSQVDFMTGMESDLRSLFGRKKVDHVHPVHVDSAVDSRQPHVNSLDSSEMDLAHMDELDLSEYVGVTLATLIESESVSMS